MAAPMRNSCSKFNVIRSSGKNSYASNFFKRSLFAAAIMTGGYCTYRITRNFLQSSIAYAEDVNKRPEFKVSRSKHYDTDSSGLKLTLFQFQTCPFCCKVRATLDYYGISYDIVEVNSVFKTQIKWSNYRKVPILMCDGVGGPDKFLQINDSSVIISLIESYLHDTSQPLDLLKSFYPGLESKDNRGKTVWEFQNKYFIMFQDHISDKRTSKERSEERKWRDWTDNVLVHVLSPNAYRTWGEALQAFRYFSEVGEWEKNFSTPERLFIIYVGALVMFGISKMLKKRHNLKPDVRESLYDAAREWKRAIVYGVLNSIEGCQAFKDMLENTKIGPWYYRTKKAVQNHQGANPLNKKS
ncbi:hypothetical protein KUTeg_022052 [Tegillarca granosa]|uniref:Glutaredoxin domain-containing protein n=1 Tax=Tegillarca granosa TaxID=220873 RepID=A0ABQ9E548_TEGGR|nr:hypothetical protein KUTeg_022052 [Tegillarca granosa]